MRVDSFITAGTSKRHVKLSFWPFSPSHLAVFRVCCRDKKTIIVARLLRRVNEYLYQKEYMFGLTRQWSDGGEISPPEKLRNPPLALVSAPLASSNQQSSPRGEQGDAKVGGDGAVK